MKTFLPFKNCCKDNSQKSDPFVTVARLTRSLFSLLITLSFAANAQTVIYQGVHDLSFGATYQATFDPAESTTLTDVTFNTEGTKYYILDDFDNEVGQYSVSVPFDLSSTVEYEGAYAISEETSPTGLAFSPGGGTMFIVGTSSKKVHQYTLTTPFDVTGTVTWDDDPLDVSGDDANPMDIAFSENGMRMFLLTISGLDITQYDLNSSFDITDGAVANTTTFTYGNAQVSNPRGMAFNADGSKMFLMGWTHDNVVQYSLSSPFDITTGVSYNNIYFNVAANEGNPNGFTFNDIGNVLYVGGLAGNSYQFELNAGSFFENLANDGSVGPSVSINIDGDTFTNPGGFLTSGSDYSISNLPAGLISTLAVASNGKSAILTLSNQASSHEASNSVASLVFDFENTAFSGNNASIVSNSQSASSDIAIKFRDSGTPVLTYNAPSAADYEYTDESYDISPESNSSSDIAFSADGKTAFITDLDADAIFQYSLTTPYDLTGEVDYQTSFSVVDEQGSIRAVTFNPTGTKMYITGNLGSREIHQYTLETPFDLTETVTPDGSPLVLYPTVHYPTGLTFSPDGLSVFIGDSQWGAVFQYDLNTAYDITDGATYVAKVTATAPQDISFSENGLTLFVLTTGGDQLKTYHLEFPYSLETGLTDGDVLSVGTQETFPEGLAFNADGSTMFIVGSGSDKIHQYQLKEDNFAETNLNDGTVGGAVEITLAEDKFTSAGSNLVSGVDFSVTNVPAGLTPQIAVSAEGAYATLTLTGKATNHQSEDGVTDMEISFANSAFENSSASIVANAVGVRLPISLNFMDNVTQLFFGQGFDLSGGVSYTGVSKDLTAQTGTAVILTFSTDGKKMLVSNGLTNILQYTLSTAFDPTTAAYDGVSFALNTDDTQPGYATFSLDGKKMYVGGSLADEINQYSLAAPFTVTEGVTHDGAADLSTASAYHIQFSREGMRFFINYNNNIYQYALNEPYNLMAGLAINENSLSISEFSGGGQFRFSPDGLKLYVLSATADNIHQYNLAVPFDVTTGVSYHGVVLSITQDSQPTSFCFNDTGSKVYVSGGQYDDVFVYQLDGIEVDYAFEEAPENDGAVSGSVLLTIVDDTFANAGGTLSEGTEFTISNLPDGLSAELEVAANGKSATLSITGNATKHQSIDGISSLTLEFNNSAVASGDASRILNAPFLINSPIVFDDNGFLTYGTGYRLENGVTYFNTLNVSEQQGHTTGVTFNADGTRMFIIGENPSDKVDQYDLSSPYNFTHGVTHSGTYSVTEEPELDDIYFNNTGDRMYIVGTGGSVIHQYNLSVAYDITSTVTHQGSQDVVASPTALEFSSDGSILYVLGFNDDAVHQYSLTDAFDITSGITHVGSYHVGSREATPYGLSISTDGTRMYIVGQTSRKIHQFNLSNAYNVTSGVTYHSLTHDVQPQTNYAQGLRFHANGQRIFVTAQSYVFQYLIKDGEFVESAANDGSVSGDLFIGLLNETFTSAGSTLEEGTDYSVDGLPDGLMPVMTVAGDGTSATLTFSGAASAHQNDNDVADLQITFENSAFSGGVAASVANSSGYSTGRSIDFRDNSAAVTYGKTYDLGSFKKAGQIDVSAQTTSLFGLEFNALGTKMYVLDYTGTIHQYSLSSPFQISEGVTYDGNPLDVSDKEGQAFDMVFSTDGTKLFLVGTQSDIIHQYSLNTPFDITGTVDYEIGVNVSYQDAAPRGLGFNNDGTKMYMIGGLNKWVFQYSLEAPYDLQAGVSYDGHPYDISGQDTGPSGIHFSPDGLTMFIGGAAHDDINVHHLTNPFDITSGVSFDNNYLYVGSSGGALSDFEFTNNGDRVIVLNYTDKTIDAYDLEIGGFDEVAKNDGMLEGELVIKVTDEHFANAEGTLSHGSDYSVLNLPSGLTPALSVSADGASATLTLSGKANNHQDADDISNLEFTFYNSAFQGGDASLVANASNASALNGIDFRDNVPFVIYGNPLDIVNMTSAGTPLDISGQDTYPTGIAFNSDGTRMFVAGYNSSSVLQYTLSTPYQVTSGATYAGSYSVSAEDAYPEDLAFSTDGTRMFVLGTDYYSVSQYNLTTPFDITSGVSYSGHSVNVENEDQSPYGLAFNPDGTKMYIGGGDNYAIIQYSVSSPFDLSSSVVFDGNPLITENEDYSPTGLAFSPDGRFLLISEDSYYGILLYSLAAPFDVTQGYSYEGNYYDLNADGIYPTAVASNPAGSRIFVVDGDNPGIAQYEIDMGGFNEAAANDGTLEGSMNLSIVDDTFTSPGATLAYGSAYTITNLPDGLTPSFTVAADGYSATLTFTGKAAVHQDATDIDGLVFNFTNSAFANTAAAGVNKATSANSGIGIDFLINTETDMLTFVLAAQADPAVIDAVNHTVTMEVQPGTSLSALVPTITLSDGATSNPASGMSQSFASPVNYTVTAEDGTTQVWQVTITEKQVAPTDITISSAAINENNSIGDAVGTFSSVDGNTSQTHLYTLVSGTGDTDNASFSVVGAELRAGAVFDHETKNQYSIRVQTDDQNGGLFQKALVITINDVNELPTDIQLSNASVNESNPVGTLVGTLTTTDQDGGQTHLYTLVSGTGSTDNASFTIAGNQLKTAAVLDFETKTTHSIRVKTDDQQGGTFEKVFVISVNDLPAQVTALTLDNQSVMENLAAGTAVGTLTTIGEDLSGSYTYTLVAGAGDTGNAQFTISGSQLLTASVFNFEAADSYSVRIKTDDGGGNTLEKAFTISVGDVAESTDANILGFVLDKQSGDAVINNAEHTVTAKVVFGTDLTSLAPEITISAKASISPASGAVQDFTNPITYTVTAEEGNTQQWTVTVSVAPNTANDIISFSVPQQTGDAVIDTEKHTVAAKVPYGTNLAALTPTITVSEQATVNPTSGAAVDFTAAVVYTVTAGSGSTQEWTVTVTPAANSATDILTFSFADQTAPAVIDAANHTINIQVATGTSLTALVPTITVSDQGTVSPASGVAQDFSAPVVYTVTAGDGTTQAWTITVTVAPASLSSAKDILTFSLAEQTAAATIDATGHTIAIEVATGTNVTGLAPTITVSAGASVSPGSGIAQDFTSPVTYTVTAEDGSKQAWTATVTVAPAPLSSARDILTFELPHQTGPAVIDTELKTVSVEVAFGTNVTALVPAITVSAAAVINPASGVVADFSAPVVYTVTAEDGSIAEWTVTVTVDEEGTATGLVDALASVNVYPNPATEYISVSGLEAGARLQLIAMDGSLVSSPAEALGGTQVVSLRLLNRGVYILRVWAEDSVKSFRIIKD